MYQSVTKFHGRVETLEQLPHLLRAAFREATCGTPRPVHLDIAGFTGDALATFEGAFDIVADEAHKRFPAFRPAPDPAAVQLAAAAINASKQPVIVADRGAIISGATGAIAELAARMRIAIGVVRVVAADLVSEGMLESFEPSENVADDVLLIARLIAGVRAL